MENEEILNEEIIDEPIESDFEDIEPVKPIEKPKPEKPKDMTHIRYGYNPDGSIRWIERNSAEFVEVLGKPDLKNRVAKLITDVDKLADEYLDSAVLYPANGKYYKPKWADTAGTYWGLMQLDDSLIKQEKPSIFPMVIKDATQLPENFVTMTRAELENLMAYLVLQIQQNYNDKTSLIGELREIEAALKDCETFEVYQPLDEHYRELQMAFDMRDYVDPNDVELSPEPEPEEILEESENSDTIEENQEISEDEN